MAMPSSFNASQSNAELREQIDNTEQLVKEVVGMGLPGTELQERLQQLRQNHALCKQFLISENSLCKATQQRKEKNNCCRRN